MRRPDPFRVLLPVIALFVVSAPAVAREHLTFDDLVLGPGPSEPVPESALAPAPGAPAPAFGFEGRLLLAAPEEAGQIEVLRDDFGLGADPNRRHLPRLEIALVSDGREMIPAVRGLQVTDHPVWWFLVEPGETWVEPEDEGWARASLPFSLVERNQNCTHHGTLTFLYSADGTVSNLWYQVTQETCSYLQADLWGLLSATWEAGPVDGAAGIAQGWADELAGRLPSKPVADLAIDFPGFDLSAFDVGVDPEQRTTYGFLADGTVYAGACGTRYGEAPYCDRRRLPSYSTAKSLFAAMALSRATLEHGPQVASEPVADWLPESDLAPGDWSGVTFEDLLDMASGKYRSPEFVVDEGSLAMSRFFLAEGDRQKTRRALGSWPDREAPGGRFVYHTSDTFLLVRALGAWLRTVEGPGVDLFDQLVAEVWQPAGLGPGAASTLRTRDGGWAGTPLGGYGLWWIHDDLAKLARLLQGGGVVDGQALLDPDRVAAALQRDPADPGLETGTGLFYNDGFWALELGPEDGFDCTFRVPFLSGDGGITVALLPNGTAYWTFSDDDVFSWVEVVRAARAVGDWCGGGARAETAADGGVDPDAAEAGESLVQGASADLAVTATTNLPDPAIGDPIVLTITVENLGPDPSAGIVVANPSLRGTRFDLVTPSQGTWDETTERWTLGDLALGATATLTVDATVEGFCWGGRARVIASDVPDPVRANDTGLVDRADVTYWVTAVGDGTSWSDPDNWTAGVPGAATTACFVGSGDYAVFLDVDAAIRRVGFGADEGIQTLRFDQPFTLTLAEDSFVAAPAGWAWDAGTLAGAGALRNDGTIRLRTAAEKILAGTIINNGSVEWRAGDWTFDDAVLENDGVVEVEADATLATAVGATGLLANRGTVHKIAGAGTTTVDLFVDADGGTLEADTGVLALTAGGRLADATLSAALGAAVDLEAGDFGVEGTLGGEPLGSVRTSPDATLTVADGLSATLGLGGTGLAWEAGRMDAPGRMVNAGLLVLDTDADKVLQVILENDGTILWDAGTVVFDDGLFENDGLLEILGDQIMQIAAGKSGTLFQRGEMVKMAGAGETRIDVVVFLETGSVTAVDSGTLAFPMETDHRPGSTLRGDGGTLQFDAVISAGAVAPGGAPGILSWVGQWLPTQSGELVVELGGLTPGSEHDQLQVTGPVTLAGTLTIELLDAFVPAPGDSFTVVTCSEGCQGAFESVVQPPGAAFDVVVDANEVRLVATELPAGPRLQIVGICPGPMTITIDGATPGGDLALLRGTQEGPGVVPGGVCAGTELGLLDPSPVALLVADAEGRAEKALNVPAQACGVPVEAVDLAACAASGVERF